MIPVAARCDTQPAGNARRWHVVAATGGGRVPECAARRTGPRARRIVLSLRLGAVRLATEVPEACRCRLAGCRQRWPEP